MIIKQFFFFTSERSNKSYLKKNIRNYHDFHTLDATSFVTFQLNNYEIITGLLD